MPTGCGGGGYVEYLLKKGYDVVGIDKIDAFIDEANRRGLTGHIYQADLAEQLPFGEKSFDTTICFDVLEHVDDEFAIRELALVTRKRLILTVPQEDRWLPRYNLAFAHYRDATHLRYYTPESLRELAAGIHPAKVEITGECPVHVRQIARTMLQPASKYPLLTNALSSPSISRNFRLNSTMSCRRWDKVDAADFALPCTPSE